MCIIPNFLVLHFGKKFKQVTDAWKFALKCEWKYVCIPIFMQFFLNFYDGHLKQQIFYSFTLLFSFKMILIRFKWHYGSSEL